ncbi:hypothetical protein Efla_002520 [Eimeria flavescens]
MLNLSSSSTLLGRLPAPPQEVDRGRRSPSRKRDVCLLSFEVTQRKLVSRMLSCPAEADVSSGDIHFFFFICKMEKVGEYEIQSVVGSGSFGKAVLVRDKEGRKLIMKLINTRQMNKEDIEEAKKEIQVLSKLVDAPFIVHYRSAFSDIYHGSPHLCIVMDFYSTKLVQLLSLSVPVVFVPTERLAGFGVGETEEILFVSFWVIFFFAGGDLGKLIKERKRQHKPFSEVTLRTWLLQLSLALDYMHSHKILHRDLKPANVFLDENNYIRVGDLGLSKILEFTLQQAKTQCGTPAFMAPELCKGRPYQAPADIWALGCIMIEAATFELPFRGLSFPELNRNICNAPAPKIPAKYSTELRSICDEMLNKDPAKRPTARAILESPCLKVGSWIQQQSACMRATTEA